MAEQVQKQWNKKGGGQYKEVKNLFVLMGDEKTIEVKLAEMLQYYGAVGTLCWMGQRDPLNRKLGCLT